MQRQITTTFTSEYFFPPLTSYKNYTQELEATTKSFMSSRAPPVDYSGSFSTTRVPLAHLSFCCILTPVLVIVLVLVPVLWGIPSLQNQLFKVRTSAHLSHSERCRSLHTCTPGRSHSGLCSQNT